MAALTWVKRRRRGRRPGKRTGLPRSVIDATVLDPGPMNCGAGIAQAVADGPAPVILDPVSNGIAMRMAVLRAVLAS